MTLSTVVRVVLPTFDLTYVVDQLSKKPEFKAWTSERFQAAVTEYRKFLALCKIYPRAEMVPSPDLDEIWHRHILNTSQYMKDCRDYFGFYLHHHPVKPVDHPSSEELETSKTKMLTTLHYYELAFGQTANWFPKLQGHICDAGCGANSVKPAFAQECEGHCGGGDSH